MGLIKNFQNRKQAVKLGRALLGEGIGFKASGKTGNMLSDIARMLQPQWSEAPQRDIGEWLDLYASSPRLDPVHKIAEDVASADWSIYKKLGDGERERIDSHPLIDLLKKPNPLPETSWLSLLYMTEVYMFIAGEAFWVLEKTGLNQIGEIWILPPNWVTSTPSLNKNYYEVQTKDGQRMEVEADDIIYFKEPNLKSPYGRGRGRAIAISDEVETDEYMSKWAKNFFFNDAKPPFVINAPGASKSDSERIQEGWTQKYGGLNNAHKPAVLPFSGSITELGNTQKEMDFVESRKFLRDQANQHFRVPPELMGIIENSNRATIDAADYIYRSSVLINRLARIQQTIQNQLIDKYFESENIEFIFDDVVPSDKDFDLKQASEGLGIGAITVDEWRQKNGWDPLDNDEGNVFLVPSSHVAVKRHLDSNAFRAVPTSSTEGPDKPDPTDTDSTEEDEVEDEVTPAEEKAYRKSMVGTVKIANWKDGYSAQQLNDIAADFTTRLEDAEEPVFKAVNKFLKAQGKRFASHVAGSNIKQMIEIVENKEVTNKDFDDAEEEAESILETFDWLAENGKMTTEMNAALLAAGVKGYDFANDVFELGVSFDLLREEMLEHIATEGLEKVVGITATTIKTLKAELIAGIIAGEGSEALARRIRQATDEYSYNRSLTIARTESHSTFLKGAYMTYELGGAENKQWMTIIDGRQRPSHSSLDGEIKRFDQPFSNKLMYPGDPKGRAEEVVRCRCALLPA